MINTAHADSLTTPSPASWAALGESECNAFTGGAGFMGSHIAKALSENGCEPVVLDNLSIGHRSSVKWGPFIEADLLDRSALDLAFKKHAIDAVIHAAGSAYVGESMADPRKYFRNNVSAAVNLLDSMAAHQVGSIVFSLDRHRPH